MECSRADIVKPSVRSSRESQPKRDSRGKLKTAPFSAEVMRLIGYQQGGTVEARNTFLESFTGKGRMRRNDRNELAVTCIVLHDLVIQVIKPVLLGLVGQDRTITEGLGFILPLVYQMLLIKRADLLNRAENKLPCLSDLIDRNGEVKNALFYCAPEQINDVSRMLGLEKGLLVSQFTNRESTNVRRELLAGFESGRWQALVAMHCLDEGVDVPNTRTAFILASSSNPREFIQRRGRILRRARGKEHAIIHDMITIPRWAESDISEMMLASERSIIRHELMRFKEFAGLAVNKHQATDVIWQLASKYGLLDF